MNAGEIGRNAGERQQKLHCQGAKKITFTAYHSGKLKLAFTSPDVISTSPKNVSVIQIPHKTSLARRAS